MRQLIIAASLTIAVVSLPREAFGAPGAVSAVAPVLAAVPDTTFKPEGSYTLNMAIGGQPLVMAFTVEKKADGTFAGIFRSSEIGDYPTTSFKLDGRTMTVTVEAPDGTATVKLTVGADNAVEGEWSMAGDGSKIAGKKNS